MRSDPQQPNQKSKSQRSLLILFADDVRRFSVSWRSTMMGTSVTTTLRTSVCLPTELKSIDRLSHSVSSVPSKTHLRTFQNYQELFRTTQKCYFYDDSSLCYDLCSENDPKLSQTEVINLGPRAIPSGIPLEPEGLKSEVELSSDHIFLRQKWEPKSDPS